MYIDDLWRNQRPISKSMFENLITVWAASWQNQQKWHVRPVWSESSLCAQWVAKDPSFLHADSEDTDQTGRMPKMICLRWAHMPFCWFCHEAAKVNNRFVFYVLHCRCAASVIEPAHEIMALFVLRKFSLQTRMRSHPVGLHVWFLVGHFVYFHNSCVRTEKALARLRGCVGSPEPWLFAYVISTIILWAGSILTSTVPGVTQVTIASPAI